LGQTLGRIIGQTQFQQDIGIGRGQPGRRLQRRDRTFGIAGAARLTPLFEQLRRSGHGLHHGDDFQSHHFGAP